MKSCYLPILFILALCISSTAGAQNAQADQSDKKVIVIKKKVDANGEAVVEKIIAEGADAEDILKEHGEEMMILDADDDVVVLHTGDPLEVQKEIRVEKHSADGAEEVEVNVTRNGDETVYRIETKDAEPVVIRLENGEVLSADQKALLEAHGVRLTEHNNGQISWTGDHLVVDKIEVDDTNGDIPGLADRIHRAIGKITDLDIDINTDVHHGIAVASTNTNCIALGVYVNSGNSGNVEIQSIIEGSGAEDAGLETGDIIRGIDKKPIGSHFELLRALSDYEPGDVVTVDYERDGVLSTVQAEVRSWKDLPEFENSWHAQVKCGDPEYKNTFDFLASPEVYRKVIIIKKGQDTEDLPENIADSPTAVNNALELQDFMAYPNPTDGKFRVEFSAEPNPVVVSIIDVSGKEIFRDNVDNFSGYYSKQIDLAGNAQGAFVLTVEQDGKIFTDRVVLH